MPYFFDTGWKKVLKIIFNIDISEEFIVCADNQLVTFFVNKTGLRTDEPLLIRLIWQKEEDFEYCAGNISKMTTHISLKYGKVKTLICWRSKSGRIYKINDTDIDCNDLHFWLEGLNPDECKHLLYPKWSLITFKNDFREQLKKKIKISVSNEFLICADKQLSIFFEVQTGLSVGRTTLITYQWRNYHRGIVSSIESSLSINAFSNYIKICWKSKSGKIYQLKDIDIDCNDIEFWMEGLDPLECHKQMYPQNELPFKLSNLSYSLRVDRLNVDCSIDMYFKESKMIQHDIILKKIDGFILAFNEKSLKKGRANGIVHNWYRHASIKKISYEIDLGSTGVYFLKGLLKFLSDIKLFNKVEIK